MKNAYVEFNAVLNGGACDAGGAVVFASENKYYTVCA